MLGHIALAIVSAGLLIGLWQAGRALVGFGAAALMIGAYVIAERRRARLDRELGR